MCTCIYIYLLMYWEKKSTNGSLSVFSCLSLVRKMQYPAMYFTSGTLNSYIKLPTGYLRNVSLNTSQTEYLNKYTDPQNIHMSIFTLVNMYVTYLYKVGVVYKYVIWKICLHYAAIYLFPEKEASNHLGTNFLSFWQTSVEWQFLAMKM